MHVLDQVGVGIKQGCPHLLSSSIGYKLSNDTSVSMLGYADNICMVSSNRRLQGLLAAKDQGRTFHLASAHPTSNHWIPGLGGVYTLFAEYRFAVHTRVRLNLLPTRAVWETTGGPLFAAIIQV